MQNRKPGKKWKHPLPIISLIFVLCGSCIFFIDLFQSKPLKIPKSIKHLPDILTSLEDSLDSRGFFIKTEGCRIPDVQASDKEVLSENLTVTCNDGLPPLIESNLTHLYLLQTSFLDYEIEKYESLKCCYSVFHRRIPEIFK